MFPIVAPLSSPPSTSCKSMELCHGSSTHNGFSLCAHVTCVLKAQPATSTMFLDLAKNSKMCMWVSNSFGTQAALLKILLCLQAGKWSLLRAEFHGTLGSTEETQQEVGSSWVRSQLFHKWTKSVGSAKSSGKRRGTMLSSAALPPGQTVCWLNQTLSPNSCREPTGRSILSQLAQAILIQLLPRENLCGKQPLWAFVLEAFVNFVPRWVNQYLTKDWNSPPLSWPFKWLAHKQYTIAQKIAILFPSASTQRTLKNRLQRFSPCPINSPALRLVNLKKTMERS